VGFPSHQTNGVLYQLINNDNNCFFPSSSKFTIQYHSTPVFYMPNTVSTNKTQKNKRGQASQWGYNHHIMVPAVLQTEPFPKTSFIFHCCHFSAVVVLVYSYDVQVRTTKREINVSGALWTRRI